MRRACVLVALALLVSPAFAQNQYCDAQPFWTPAGDITPGTADWSSQGDTSGFIKGPCLGVSGLGTTETYRKTFIVIDRAATKNGYLYLPGRPDDVAYAQEVDLVSRAQRALNVITNPFCSSGQHMPNGSLLSIGGDWSPDYAGPGEFSIRLFDPCNDGTCDFKIVARLANSRWYPTTTLLGDGRVIIVGGSSRGVGLNVEAANVPTVEYYPKAAGGADVSYELQLLADTLPYNLYPFVLLLPSGRVFIFAGTQWTLWDTTVNAVAPGNYPALNAQDAGGARIQFSYPISATSALFPLHSVNDYAAEVMICGGGGEPSIQFQGEQAVQDADYPTSNKCFRIFPEAAEPEWAEEEMKLPRVMPNAVLLPDGHLFICGGAGTGYAGFGTVGHKPSLVPEMYDTSAHAWRAGALAASKIPRSYHSSAVLVHDGSVLLSGSNPNDAMKQGEFDFPTEFRTEFFLPPYMFRQSLRPVVVAAPAEAAHGALVSVAFRFPAGRAKRVRVVLAQPGFSTHGYNHGMRNVVLDIRARRNNTDMHVVTAVVPRNRNLLPPTWYWLFVVVNGRPNREGKHIFIK